MKKLTITRGEEFRQVVRARINEDDIFIDEYRRAARMLSDVIDTSAIAMKCSGQPDGMFHEFENNIIAFCGGRGDGKSSAMLTFMNAVYRYAQEDYKSSIFQSNIKETYFAQPIVIDPSTFDDVHNVIDIIIAKLYQNFNRKYEQDNNKVDVYIREKLLDQFQKVYRRLSLINNKEKLLDNEYDYEGNIGKLSKLGESTNLKETLIELIRLYLDFMKRCEEVTQSGSGQLLIAIDDLDLCNANAYKMAEQIRKYLIIPQVTVLMAVRIEQLELCVAENNMNDFQQIARRGFYTGLNQEIQVMSEKYVTKLIPKFRRIYLPKIQDIKEVHIEYRQLEEASDQAKNNIRSLPADTVYQLLHLIYTKTGMIFTKDETGHSYLISDNLRDLVNFWNMLMDLEEVDESFTIKEKYDIYVRNILRFTQYYEKELIGKMPMEIAAELLEIETIQDHHMHFNAVWFLRNELYHKTEKRKAETSEYRIEGEAGLFNVINWLEKMQEDVYDLRKKQYAYALHVLYTTKLHQLKIGMLAERKYDKYESFVGRYIWGRQFDKVLPSVEQTKVNRSRFELSITNCLNAIGEETFREYPINSEMILTDKGNAHKISKEEDIDAVVSVWLILGLLSDPASKDPVIRGNFAVTKILSISLENYLVSLGNLHMLYDKINFGMITSGNKDEFDKRIELLEKWNEKSVACAREIISNVDLLIGIRKYLEQKNDYKKRASENSNRTVPLVDVFFSNIAAYMNQQLAEKEGNVREDRYRMEDFKYFKFGEKADETVDISVLYDALIERCISEQKSKEDAPLNARRKELEDEFRSILTERPKYPDRYPEGGYKVSKSLRNFTAGNFKLNLDNYALNFQQYYFVTDGDPSDFDINNICGFYNEVLQYYVLDEKANLTENFRQQYKKTVENNQQMLDVIRLKML